MALIHAIVAEDNRALRDALQTLLPMKNISPTFCIDGDELFKQVREHLDDFDVAIVDVTLPDACGFDIVAQLRKLGFDRPVILCSGSAENKQRVEESGGNHFLMKPYSPEELIDVIQWLVDEMREEI